jgi:hypothetical protein
MLKLLFTAVVSLVVSAQASTQGCSFHFFDCSHIAGYVPGGCASPVNATVYNDDSTGPPATSSVATLAACEFCIDSAGNGCATCSFFVLRVAYVPCGSTRVWVDNFSGCGREWACCAFASKDGCPGSLPSRGATPSLRKGRDRAPWPGSRGGTPSGIGVRSRRTSA